MNWVETAINGLMDWVGKLASVLLILLVVVVTYNVIARYGFSASSVGLEEFAWHLYFSVFMLGLSYALKTGSHVRVDLIFEHLPLKVRASIDLIGSLIFLIPFCLLTTYHGWAFMLSAKELGMQPDSLLSAIHQLATEGIGERSQDPGGLMNRFIIKGMVPLSMALLLVSSLSFVLHKIRVLMDLEAENETDHGTH